MKTGGLSHVSRLSRAKRSSCLLVCLSPCLTLLIGLTLLMPFTSQAQGIAPPQAAEAIRSDLLQAQLALSREPASAQRQVADIQRQYAALLAPQLAAAAPATEARASAALVALAQATEAPRFAAARAQLWTALLDGSYQVVLGALAQGDLTTAKAWLPLREYRQANRVARPGADATLALVGLANNTLERGAAAAAVRADLLDAYQARLGAALADLALSQQQGYAARSAESAALAEGYFAIIAGAYAEQHGVAAQAQASQRFADLTAAAIGGDSAALSAGVAQLSHDLAGFRAVPLSPAEQINRAGKVLRYVSLIGPNYGRGVRDGQVTNQIEVEEARTFRDAAAEAFADLQSALPDRGVPGVAAFQNDLATLQQQIDGLAEPQLVQQTADGAEATFKQIVPAEWLQTNPSADFDAMRELLVQVEKAVAAKQYPQAESARLDAYAILDAGPEIRLRALAPDQAADLAGLFWQGAQGFTGLATLIAERADLATVEATTAAIRADLLKAQTLVGSGNATPGAVIGNAAVIIFRQGLEAVVILASLFAGLRKAADAKYRMPLALGAIAAGVASVGCWFVLRAVLNQFAALGGRLEAIVSIVSVLVLLVILNWFFHNIYWVGWLSGIQKRKKRSLVSQETGQMIALATVGFTSVFREGFETALFSQVLVLEAGAQIVLWGLLLGALPIALLGLITFRFQAKLPYKMLLIISGVLIALVLVQMMGQTIHAMQAVRWMSVTPIGGVTVPYWMGIWFGIYPTWEGLIAQAVAGTLVFGSYFLAEQQQDKKVAKARVSLEGSSS